MKKGWISKHVIERFWGKRYDRWYIKSPSGNFYHLHRCHEGKHPSCATIYLAQAMVDNINGCAHPIPMIEFKPNEPWERWNLNRIFKALYEIEETGSYPKELDGAIKYYKIKTDGTYPKALSDAIENYPECKALFA